MGSLQDALLKAGLAEERQDARGKWGKRGGPEGRPPRKGSPRTGAKTAGKGKKSTKKRRPNDLERAWAARRKAEKAEQERARQARVADQEARRQRNLELDRVVAGKILNVEDAEVPRYFEHLGRIRRVLCTPQQRDRINAGELGIVGLRGRYLIVEPDVLERYRRIAPDLVPDLGGAEPDGEEAGYPPVPDDLTW